MAIRKDDPMYYKNIITKLIKEAEENGLNVYCKKNIDGHRLYFEAHECEIWSVKLPMYKESEEK